MPAGPADHAHVRAAVTAHAPPEPLDRGLAQGKAAEDDDRAQAHEPHQQQQRQDHDQQDREHHRPDDPVGLGGRPLPPVRQAVTGDRIKDPNTGDTIHAGQRS